MNSHEHNVLVGVLKSPWDLRFLLEEKWYRIPLAFTPKRPFAYLAFYQPTSFGTDGKQIRYFAKITGRTNARRVELLPNEASHPRANDLYARFSFSEIDELANPIRNIIPRRVTFGFTTLNQLQTATNLLELYGVPATEQIVAQGLEQMGIPVTSEYPIGYSAGRFRIDLAVACRNGWLAIECDNLKAHRLPAQQRKDQHKDEILGYHGWRVVRLTERDILDNYSRTMARLRVAIASLGGLVTDS